jgi:hypothetical protein
MPSFTISDVNTEIGLIVPITISDRNQNVSVHGNAEIDTGASHTSIRDDIPELLELKAIGKIPV